MELLETLKLQLLVLLAGIPVAIGIGATIAAFTTPLPERGRKRKAPHQ